MSATSQHGFHPDAESLSAFAEQALGERERAEVLAHLAVCGRCRQVVTLAREAADSGAVESPAKSRKSIEPNAWWKQWRLVWIPTAIVASFFAVSIAVYIGQVDRRGPTAKVVQPNAAPGAEPASTPPPTEQAETTPSASPAPAPPPTHAAKQTHPATREPLPTPTPPPAAAQMPQAPGATNHVEAARETPASHTEEQSPSGLTAGAAPPAYSQPAAAPPENKQQQAEEQRQAQANPPRERSFGAMRAPAAGHGANQPAPPAASETVTVTDGTAPPAVPQVNSLAQIAPTPDEASSRKRKLSARAKPIQLPGGLAVVSSTSSRPVMLAIDKTGALFLSEDEGGSWERIDKQWKGRAVEVTQQPAASAGLPSAPTGQYETAPNAPSASPASPPSMIFELLNDKGQAWVSTDGRAWTPK